MVLLSNDISAHIKRHPILKCLKTVVFNVSAFMQEETLKEADVISTVAETSPESVSPQHHQNPSAARGI
jgi:hypothetical protein